MKHSLSNVAAIFTLMTATGLWTASGCGVQSVTVAEGERSFDGGPGTFCANNDDCVPTEYCAMSACGSDAGACEKRPSLCDNELDPVCDCEGLLYWNDCLRRQNGIRASLPSAEGVCEGLFGSCDGESMTQCPPIAICNRIVPGPASECSLSPVGACWVLPPTCPEDSGVPPLRSCGPGPHVCEDFCLAIQSNEPFQTGRCE